jgi:hypothetical protein
MGFLELRDEQVVSLVRQLPAGRKRTALPALAQDARTRREERMRFGEEQLRRACAERGRDWDRLSENERETCVNELLHEK